MFYVDVSELILSWLITHATKPIPYSSHHLDYGSLAWENILVFASKYVFSAVVYPSFHSFQGHGT